ncbi:MAG: methylated-DNA--[protein]-cysteine S-methyltransferase [Candidatus Thorarchaeota archaeon]
MNRPTLAIQNKDDEYVAGIFTEKGLFSTSLPCKNKSEAIKAVNGTGIERDDNPRHLKVLDAVFAFTLGEDIAIEQIELDFSGITEKQEKVLRTTLMIPRGSTMTYGEVARKSGFENAARFVGNVMASNRFAPIIPCHRVVGSSGLGGYGFGLDKKREILRLEGVFAE